MKITNLVEGFIREDAPLIGEAEATKRLDAMRILKACYQGDSFLNTEQLNEVMTTAHFTAYFTDAISRKFISDYKDKPGSWKTYTLADEAPDFRDVRRFRGTQVGNLTLRMEKAEPHATQLGIGEIHFGVEEYSEQFDISWRALLNDDLGYFRDIPQKMLNAAWRFENAFVSNLYDNGVTQAALIALGAAYAGTGRLTAANLAIGLNAFRARVDALGNPIAIQNVWLVIPPVLEIQAATILESMLMAGVATNDKNILPRFVRGVCVDPYIATAAPNIPWYLFADPSDVPAVDVLRLSSAPLPFVYMKASDIKLVSGSVPAAFALGDFATGDVEYAVSDIIGGWDSGTLVGVVDPNGIYYSSGTTP